jgi:hypothetical protein
MKTYPLLGELSCPLVLAVAEQLDYSSLIGGETDIRVKSISIDGLNSIKRPRAD